MLCILHKWITTQILYCESSIFSESIRGQCLAQKLVNKQIIKKRMSSICPSQNAYSGKKKKKWFSVSNNIIQIHQQTILYKSLN